MKLHKALETIKNECSIHVTCNDCPLSWSDGCCGIKSDFPKDWRIKKPVFKLFEEGEE